MGHASDRRLLVSGTDGSLSTASIVKDRHERWRVQGSRSLLSKRDQQRCPIRVPPGALVMLERSAVKVACSVLRGLRLASA